MSNPIIDALEKEQLKSNLPEFSPLRDLTGKAARIKEKLV